MYTAAKGWRTRKLQTTKHMIKKWISFDIQGDPKGDVGLRKTNTDNEHYNESCWFEEEIQTMVRELFDIIHGHDVESQDRGNPLAPLLNAQPHNSQF